MVTSHPDSAQPPSTPPAGAVHADLFRDFAFSAPAAWRQRAVLSFRASYAGPNAPAVVIVREWMHPDEDISTHVAAKKTELETLPGYTPVASRMVEIDGVPAHQIVFEWVAGSGAVEQTTTIVETSMLGGGRIRTTFTMTCTKEHAPGVRQLFEQMLESAAFGPTSLLRSDVVPAPPSSDITVDFELDPPFPGVPTKRGP